MNRCGRDVFLEADVADVVLRSTWKQDGTEIQSDVVTVGGCLSVLLNLKCPGMIKSWFWMSNSYVCVCVCASIIAFFDASPLSLPCPKPARNSLSKKACQMPRVP